MRPLLVVHCVTENILLRMEFDGLSLLMLNGTYLKKKKERNGGFMVCLDRLQYTYKCGLMNNGPLQ